MNRHLPLAASLFALAALAACSGDEELPDAAVQDAGVEDSGIHPDAGEDDAGAPEDAGAMDAGPADAGELQLFETLRDRGTPDNRVHLVFIGDGYTREQLSTLYVRHVNHLNGRMFSAVQAGATEPFRAFATLISVHRINLASPESGIDNPARGVTVDTPLDGTTECTPNGLCHVDAAKVREAVQGALAGRNITPTVVMVALNTEERFAASFTHQGWDYVVYGGGPSRQNNNNGSPAADANTSDLALRELARVLGGVAFETTTPPGGTYLGDEPSAPNVTTSSVSKWSAWMGYDVQNDGVGPVGRFEGGGGYERGLFRPTTDSKMGAGGVTGSVRSFNAVVREAIILGIFRRIRPLDSYLDNAQRLTDPPRLFITEANVGLIQKAWYFDGELVEGITDGVFGATQWAQANGVPGGAHTVTLRATVVRRFRFPNPSGMNQSPFTDFLRSDDPSLTQEVTWDIMLTR